MLDQFATVIAALMIAMLYGYLRHYRNHPIDKFVPMAAWLRAGIYFCFCFLVSYLTGTMEVLLNTPLYTAAQTENSSWWIWIIGLSILITTGYWVIWARFTIRFERKLDLIPQVLFGLVWGLASGQLFLSFWHMALAMGPEWATWQTWLLAYVMISVWQAFWQDYYWDVYISPEHDSPWSIIVKVPATHIPNVTFCLIFFALYENYWIFIALQTWALLGASIAMRMPAPWSKDETVPSNRVKGLLGFTRASGYISKDPANDKYLKAAHLPR
jgi:hypothetical protein